METFFQEHAEHPYVKVLNEHFGGILEGGSHSPNGVGCALEVASMAKLYVDDPAAFNDPVSRRDHWSDYPEGLGLPDVRALNDLSVWPSNEARVAALVPVVVALWDWRVWPEKARAALIRSVKERLPETELFRSLKVKVENGKLVRQKKDSHFKEYFERLMLLTDPSAAPFERDGAFGFLCMLPALAYERWSARPDIEEQVVKFAQQLSDLIVEEATKQVIPTA